MIRPSIRIPFVFSWLLSVLSCSHAGPSSDSLARIPSESARVSEALPTIQPRRSRLAVNEGVFCALRSDQSLRCRFVAEPISVPKTEHPAGAERFDEIVAYGSGFCGLREDRSVECWPGGEGGSQDEILVFEGEFLDLASSAHAACALDLEGRMHCASARGGLGYHEVRARPAVVVHEGPFEALRGHRLGRDVCGVRLSGPAWCAAPRARVGELPSAEDWWSFGMSGAVQEVASFPVTQRCGIDLEGGLRCEASDPERGAVASRYEAFAGRRLTRFAATGLELCAADERDQWVCVEGVETPPLPLRDAVIVRSIDRPGFELHGIDGEGVWQTPSGPLEHVRHEFRELARAPLDIVCGLRTDDTVYCQGGLLYDDDRLQNVTRLTSGRAFIETNHGRIGRSLDSGEGRWKGYGNIFGRDDPRNREVSGYVDVQHGNDFGCGLRSSGEVTCWGRILGHPVARAPAVTFEKIALTGHTACGITRGEGQLVCWGANRDPFGPGMVPSGGGFVELATSYQAFCGRRDDNSVECWGGVAFSEHPFRLPFETTSFTLTDSGVCGIVPASREVRCWGTGYRW